MKTPRFIWVVLLVAAALGYLQPISQPSAARIRIESDSAVLPSQTTTATLYDFYFVTVNHCAQILIPGSGQK